MSSYNYSISSDTSNSLLNSEKLSESISSSTITSTLTNISSSGDTVTINFDSSLTTEEKTTLDALISAHDGTPTPEQTPVEIDSDGRQITKVATTYKGWRYLAHSIEAETSKLNGCFSSDWQGNSRTDFTMKFYNSSGTELVAGTQAELDANCVKTVITLKPDYDYDIIGGNVHQHTTPTSDVRLWVIAGATELGALGVTEFVGGLNFKYITPGDKIETDGRASARLNKNTEGVPFQTNQLQYIITHPTGHNHQIMIVVEYFR